MEKLTKKVYLQELRLNKANEDIEAYMLLRSGQNQFEMSGIRRNMSSSSSPTLTKIVQGVNERIHQLEATVLRMKQALYHQISTNLTAATAVAN